MDSHELLRAFLDPSDCSEHRGLSGSQFIPDFPPFWRVFGKWLVFQTSLVSVLFCVTKLFAVHVSHILLSCAFDSVELGSEVSGWPPPCYAAMVSGFFGRPPPESGADRCAATILWYNVGRPTQGFLCTRQALWHLNPTPSPALFGF